MFFFPNIRLTHETIKNAMEFPGEILMIATFDFYISIHCTYSIISAQSDSREATLTQAEEQNVSRLNWQFALLLRLNLDLESRRTISREQICMKTILKSCRELFHHNVGAFSFFLIGRSWPAKKWVACLFSSGKRIKKKQCLKML